MVFKKSNKMNKIINKNFKNRTLKAFFYILFQYPNKIL